MGIQRHFIGWSTPVTTAVRRHLIPDAITQSVDLGDTLVIVPTRQASRRLREALAAHCAEANAALLSAEVVLPAALFRSRPLATQRESSALLTQTAWTDVLRTTAPSDFEELFPPTDVERSLAWAGRTGETLQKLRATLADGGYSIQGVVDQYADSLDEQNRWQELAEIENRYLKRIEELGYKDATLQKVEQASAPSLPDGIKRIVVASVPDPSLLMIRALEALEKTYCIDILIAAPDDQAQQFDAWGRPEPDAWKSSRIEIPNADCALVLTGTPKSQAERAIRIITENAEQFGPGDIAIGVPDKTVIPFLETTLTEHGLPAFDPSERYLKEHPIFGVLDGCIALHTTRTYSALRDVIRLPDVLAFLKTEGLRIDAILTQLDELQGQYLPLGLDDVLAHLDTASFDSLSPAIERVCELVALFESRTPAAAAQTLLQTLYRKRMISSKSPDDQAFSAAADTVSEVIRELSECETVLPSLDTGTALHLLRQRLAGQTYHADREDSQIDLEGWLELPWNDAPFMIATGMNEGRVPDGRLSDMFLPDSLRRKLGLRNDAGRLARDAYLMTLMIESRRDAGKTIFIVGKTSAGGDPLKPSRLLFRCAPPELPSRAEMLFAPVEDREPHHASTVSFKLSPLAPLGNKPLSEAVSKLSVTAFRSYLACPFRFYLNNVLYMRSLDDSKREMDALDFGIMMHAALEKMGKSGMWKHRDEEELADYLISEAEGTLAHRFPSPPPLPVKIAMDAARQRLRHAARVQVELVQEGWDLIRTEARYEMSINGLPIRGTVDRVDQNRDTGTFRIIDYKTSDQQKAPIAMHLASCRNETPDFAQVTVDGKQKRWVDLQLPLYHRLLQTNNVLSGQAEIAYFNLPKAVMQTGVYAWENWTPALADSAHGCAEAIVHKIQSGIFWPPEDRVAYDDFESLFPDIPEACFEAMETGGQKTEVRSQKSEVSNRGATS